MASDLKYGDLTEKSLRSAMTAHRKMGSGNSELIYSRCFTIELNKTGIHYKTEVEWPVYYDQIIVAKRRVDFIIEDRIAMKTRALNYLQSHKIEGSLLTNFRTKSLHFRRLINEEKNFNKSNSVNAGLNPENPVL